jgi:hypothetical protein
MIMDYEKRKEVNEWKKEKRKIGRTSRRKKNMIE